LRRRLEFFGGWLVGLVWLLLYAHRHRSILGAAGHIILTPANQLMEEYSEPSEQSCLLRWTEKIASLCFGRSEDRTPYLLIRSQPLIDCATGPGGVNSSSSIISRMFFSFTCDVASCSQCQASKLHTEVYYSKTYE
jgi:hypothetical protein